MVELKNKILFFLILVFGAGCNGTHTFEVLAGVFPEYEQFEHKKEYFLSRTYVDPHLILYKGRMGYQSYKKIIENSILVPNCKELRGLHYEKMSDIIFPFALESIEWWSPIINSHADFVGHYDRKLGKYTKCEESIQYRYAFAYKDGYCYLIIENTLQTRL